jgi:membrane protease YdiL (CAAX protease family)
MMPDGTSPEPLPSPVGAETQASTRGVTAVAEVWSLGDLILFLAFGFLSLLAAYVLVVAGYELLSTWKGWRLTTGGLATNPFIALTLQSVSYMFLLGFTYLLVAIRHRQPFWRALGWRKPTLRQGLGYLLGGAAMMVAIRFAPPLLPDSGSFPLEQLFTSPAAAYAVGAFAILIAPLMEEVIFRGVLFAIFERRVGLRFAVLSTAVLFAALHAQEYWQAWNHLLMILFVGLVLSAARGITGSLASSVLLHMGYNTSMMAGLFFATHYFQNLPGVISS